MANPALEKFNRHIGKPVKVELENEDGEKDTFELKPLNIEQYVRMMMMAKRINREDFKKEGMTDEEAGKKMFENMNKEDIQEMMDIYIDIVKKSYPELDNDTASRFVATNLDKLSNLMDKLVPSVDSERARKLKELAK